MLSRTARAVVVLVAVSIPPAMSDNAPNQPLDGAMFITTGRSDAEFSRAIQQSQASLPVFRKLLRSPEHAPSSGALRMVKTRIADESESVWLWLVIKSDEGDGFTASVFEAPPELQRFRPGVVLTVNDSDVGDWAVIDSHGMVSGGYSFRLHRARQPESESAAYDAYIGAKTYAPLPPDMK